MFFPRFVIGGRFNSPYQTDLASRILDMGVGTLIDSRLQHRSFDLVVPSDLLPMIDSG